MGDLYAMGENKSVVPLSEGEENLIAAAQHIARALETNKNLTFDAWKILSDLGSQLSAISVTRDGKEGGELGEIESRLKTVEKKIVNWEADQSMIWDFGPEEAYEYLKAVDEARKLSETLDGLNLSKDNDQYKLVLRSHDVLQTAMTRLEDEFGHILVQNRQSFEPEHLSFRSSEEDVLENSSTLSFGNDSVEDVVQRDSISRSSEEFIIDLIHPEAIPDLKCIANLIFDSNYGRECSQSFVNVRKYALDDCLFILEVEKLSIEDVLKMEWNALNSKIRRWIRAMKIFVRVYLSSEKFLSDQIFGDIESMSSICFFDSSKASILRLLNFGEAVAIGPRQPEKLFRILDMYDVLSDLIPDIESLYSDDAGSYIRKECHDVLTRLGDCVKSTFLEFENAVASNVSTNPFAGGGIHHLTRYVMNYIKTLTDYRETLNFLLNEKKLDLNSIHEESEEEENDPCVMTRHFRSLLAILESNLHEKSKLYKDDSLRHIFMMNNVHYMAEKVKGCPGLRKIMGDQWIRNHNGKFQTHAMNYERSTWSSILSLLRDEGLHNPGSSSISKTLLKEKLSSFYAAFEEVYKSQTGWLIPDSRLREDLRIATALKVIMAYRTFVGRQACHVSDKYIRYHSDDLEAYILDLFEGSPKSLHNSHRK